MQRDMDAELRILHEDREVPAGNDSSEIGQRLEEAQQWSKDCMNELLRVQTEAANLKEIEEDVKRRLEEAGYGANPNRIQNAPKCHKCNDVCFHQVCLASAKHHACRCNCVLSKSVRVPNSAPLL